MRAHWLTLATLSIASLLAAGCGEKDGNPQDDSTDDSTSGADSSPEEVDADSDGYNATEDCDDGNPDVNPGATEVCDGRDNNCDGAADDDDPNVSGQSEWYTDSDGDGFGDESAAAQLACEAPDDTAAEQGDCDDSNADIHPDGTEVCDGVDNDCDAQVDAADPTLSDGVWYYPDADADGYGASGSGEFLCEQPSGYTTDDSDCDDTDRQIKPGGRERCSDGVDNNCDGSVDGDDTACGGGGTTGPTKWDGVHYYLLDYDETAEVSCTSIWNETGTARKTWCSDCEWAFDIVGTFDAASSVDGGIVGDSCFDYTGSDDYAWALGYDSDIYGYGFAYLWYYSPTYSTWYPFAYTYWDGSSIFWVYGGRYFYQYPYGDYYYTFVFGGYGTVE